MSKISKEQACEIAFSHLLNVRKERMRVYADDEFKFDHERIYGFDNLQKRWQGKSVWFVISPEMPNAICSSDCTVIDRNTGEVLASFSLQDEG